MKIRLVGSDEKTEPAPKPEVLGIRGVTNDGVQFVFDRPVALLDDHGPSNIWMVPYHLIGHAILSIGPQSADGTFRKMQDLCPQCKGTAQPLDTPSTP